MGLDQELLDREYARGEESGLVKARLGTLESVVVKMGISQEASIKVQNTLVTTVELLATDIKNRAESDRKLREQEKLAAEEKAQALKDERINAAAVLKDDRELTAINLANKSNKTNIRFTPIAVVITGLSVLVAVFFGGIALAKSNAKAPCVIIANVGCVIK